MKETQMPPLHAVNLVANSGNTAYGVESIMVYIISENIMEIIDSLWPRNAMAT